MRAAAAEPAAPESAAVGSEASPCPAPAPRGVESSDRAARRLPAALGFRHKQQRGSKKTASSVRSGNVGPATAREGRHLRGRGLVCQRTKPPASPTPPELAALPQAVPPAAQPTSPAPPPQATWMWGLSQEAGCTEREAGCMGEVAGVPQETGRPEFSSGWGRGVQEGGGPRGKGLMPQRRRRQESRASRTHAGSRRARVSSDETGARKTPGPRPGRGATATQALARGPGTARQSTTHGHGPPPAQKARAGPISSRAIRGRRPTAPAEKAASCPEAPHAGRRGESGRRAGEQACAGAGPGALFGVLRAEEGGRQDARQRGGPR